MEKLKKIAQQWLGRNMPQALLPDFWDNPSRFEAFASEIEAGWPHATGSARLAAPGLWQLCQRAVDPIGYALHDAAAAAHQTDADASAEALAWEALKKHLQGIPSPEEFYVAVKAATSELEGVEDAAQHARKILRSAFYEGALEVWR